MAQAGNGFRVMSDLTSGQTHKSYHMPFLYPSFLPLLPGPPAEGVWVGLPAGLSARTGLAWFLTRALESRRLCSAVSLPSCGSEDRETRAHSAAAEPEGALRPTRSGHHQTALWRCIKQTITVWSDEAKLLVPL